MRPRWAILGMLPLAAAIAVLAAQGPGYVEAVQAWQVRRQASLRDPEGWLSLAGLFPLPDGRLALGSAPDNDLVFPEAAPARIGHLDLQPAAVRLEVAPGVEVLADETAATAVELLTDAVADGPTKLRTGSLSWWVIERAGRRWLRLSDAANPALSAPAAIEFFPIDPAWRVSARLQADPTPTGVSVPTVLGLDLEEPSAGILEFEIDGQVCRLQALAGEEGDLFVLFADRTSGHSTYGSGRFLWAAVPDAQGGTQLDFNRAYNPPCAFTPYATCPLPPAGNRLGVAVTAGEKTWSGAGH